MINMENKNKTLRKMLKVVENLTFYPEWGRNRLKAMLMEDQIGVFQDKEIGEFNCIF